MFVKIAELAFGVIEESKAPIYAKLEDASARVALIDK
jgi:hypothetical protein